MEETDDDFTERLQAAIDEAREEIEKETEQYRQDLEKAYKARVCVCVCVCVKQHLCVFVCVWWYINYPCMCGSNQ